MRYSTVRYTKVRCTTLHSHVLLFHTLLLSFAVLCSTALYHVLFYQAVEANGMVYKVYFIKYHFILHQAVEASGMDVTLVSTQWLMLCFVSALPTETTLRVWDLLFLLGPTIL